MLTMKLAGPAAASGLEAAGRGEQARERHPTYDDDAVKILPENGVNQVLSEDLGRKGGSVAPVRRIHALFATLLRSYALIRLAASFAFSTWFSRNSSHSSKSSSLSTVKANWKAKPPIESRFTC